MADPEIVLEWWRDASGYDLLEPTSDQGERIEALFKAKPELSDRATDPDMPINALAAMQRGVMVPDVTLPERLFQPVDQGKPERIRRKGGTLVPYRPTDTLDFIFRDFVNTPTNAEGVLSFVNRFGLLYYSDRDQLHEEPVSKIVANIEFMNAVIDEISAGEHADKVLLFGADGTNLANLKARFTLDEVSGAPKVTFVPLSLMAALWLHFGQILSSDTTVLRRCLQCNALFDAGVGSGRRKDSKFCTDAHRALFHNQRLSERRIEALDEARSRKRPRRGAA
jgi:hypothetical protein